MAGGTLTNGGATPDAEIYDAATGTWTTTASLDTARDAHTATLLSGSTVLIAGGRGTADFLANAELFLRRVR